MNNYHTNGFGTQIFNNQKFTQLKNESRFRENTNQTMAVENICTSWSPDSPNIDKTFTNQRGLNKSMVIDSTKDGSQKMYDIKGNTFKNTLIPKQTGISSALNFANNTSQNWSNALSPVRRSDMNYETLKLAKTKPEYKGYVRSGQILNNNIAQIKSGGNTPKSSMSQSPYFRQNFGHMAKSVVQSRLGEIRVETKNLYNEWNDQMEVPANQPLNVENPCKQSQELKKTMDQIKSYSPDHNKKKFNNYDNFVKNSQRVIHDQFEMNQNI